MIHEDNCPVEPKIDDVDLRQIDENVVDTYHPEGLDYPIVEYTNNAIFWPEAPKGRIDLNDTYEVSSVPVDPDTPLESIDFLEHKHVMPN